MTETEFRPVGKGGAPSRRAHRADREGRTAPSSAGRSTTRAPAPSAASRGTPGLFGTADDLARYARALLGDGGGWLSPAGVAAMTRVRDYGDGDLRALGWDVETHYSTSRGDLFPLGSFGHTGWTGTSMWLDPATDTFVVVLSARNHPDGAGNAIPLRSRLATRRRRRRHRRLPRRPPPRLRRGSPRWRPGPPPRLAAGEGTGARPPVRRPRGRRRPRGLRLRRREGKARRPPDEPHRRDARRAGRPRRSSSRRRRRPPA